MRAPPTWTARLAEAPAEWLCLDAVPDAMLVAAQEALDRMRLSVPDRAAAVEPVPGGLRLWRRPYLVALLRAGLVAEDAPVEALARAAARNPFVFGPGITRRARRGRVLLVSAFGQQRFGGVEHFLAQMARLYASLGYEPRILGARRQAAVEEGPDQAVAGDPDQLMRLALEEDAVLAHVVSGLGHEVTSALRHLDIQLVFGIHFWRELFHPRTAAPGYYPDCPEGHTARPTFPLLLSDCDAAYANSTFTQEVAARLAGARLPVIPSLPDDVGEDAGQPPGHAARDCVLLANARFDKGFGLLLDLAARLPQVRFLAVAGQSSAAAARAAAAARGLTNVEIRPPVADLGLLYRRARAVLVPSYRFVETFSRVVVEAHRHGVPVLGSDRGNVPRLLREAGQVLPEDPTAWAAALKPLWEDGQAWSIASTRALEASARRPFSAQAPRLARLLQGLDQPMLVAVGSGLGNLLHTTPLVRRLAEARGAPVDVLCAADWPGAAAVMAHPDHVRHCFEPGDLPLRRAYDTVFVTHSFGRLRLPYRARRVLHSRDWRVFSAGGPLHEAEYNLAAAQALLGISYAREDIGRGFVGGVRYARRQGRRIGLHAGSKGGIWATKRWPGYAALAARLQAEGFEVASFGTPDEHVEGTLDLTGGSILEMAERMLTCSGFVANDSGVMNLANTLGIPLVALFAPTAPATRAPLGGSSLTLAVDAPCAPCELNRRSEFTAGRCDCIAAIGVEAVCAALHEVLARALAASVGDLAFDASWA